ncbi:MAG: cytochrome C [Thioalkalivibrio sp.]|nr:cytochrome C [Thioalkalivibrio sp.]
MIVRHLTLACLFAVVVPGTASAENLSEPDGKMLSNTCAACHGTYGHFENDYMPPLAGMKASRFIESMIAFREGARPAAVMDRVARAFSDAEIEAMADFYARQDRAPPAAVMDDATQGTQGETQ